jgi:hypothetical protein
VTVRRFRAVVERYRDGNRIHIASLIGGVCAEHPHRRHGRDQRRQLCAGPVGERIVGGGKRIGIYGLSPTQKRRPQAWCFLMQTKRPAHGRRGCGRAGRAP